VSLLADAAPAPYAAELAVACAAARAAGAILLRYAAQSVRYGFKRSRDRGREVVSEADLAADEAIRTAILAAFPADGWLSEEHPDDAARLTRARVWIVDPLDGTREFLSAVPEYAVSIALAEDGVPVVGAVYNPARDVLVAVGAGRAPAPEGAGLGLDLATRLADTFVLVGRGEWHWGGLPRAAGAVVTDRHGRPLRFNRSDPLVDGCLAGNAALHQEALAIWQRSGWERGG